MVDDVATVREDRCSNAFDKDNYENLYVRNTSYRYVSDHMVRTNATITITTTTATAMETMAVVEIPEGDSSEPSAGTGAQSKPSHSLLIKLVSVLQ